MPEKQAEQHIVLVPDAAMSARPSEIIINNQPRKNNMEKRRREKLRKELKEFYNSSEGYLSHLNEKRGDYFDYYFAFIDRYLKKLDKNSRILEIGCGDGFTTYSLSKRYPQFSFTGIDISKKFIDYARNNFKNNNLSFKVSDSLELSFKDNSFDAVISTDVLEHISDVPKFLDEYLRVTKKNGLMIIVTGNHFSPIQPLYDIATLKKRHPWEDTRLKRLKLLIKKTILFFYNTGMIIKKEIKPGFMYKKPNLKMADIGADFDAVYYANQKDLKWYLKDRVKILNLNFRGNTLSSKILGLLPSIGGIGFVGRKK